MTTKQKLLRLQAENRRMLRAVMGGRPAMERLAAEREHERQGAYLAHIAINNPSALSAILRRR